MNILNVQHIQKSYGTDVILRDVHFSIEQGEKVGLVGRNGAGKTTLFRILTGQLEPDAGQIRLVSGIRRGYLEQDPVLLQGESLLEYCQTVFLELLRQEQELQEQEKTIAEISHEDPLFNDLLIQYHERVERFDSDGGYTFRSRIRGTLKGLGFTDSEINDPVSRLSGGQLTRLSIARLLLSEPDLLLLDEPTNHLDIQAVQWLENYLRQYSGTLVLITHDRFFLDQVTNRIIEIELGKTLSCDGNYSHFQQFKRKTHEAMEKAYEKQETEVARQEELIRRFKQHGTEKLAKRAKSREKHLEQMVRIDAPESDSDAFRIRFEVAAPSGRDVLTIEDLAMAFGDTPLFDNLSFNLYRGERVGLVGPNGVGKTTLFRLIEEELKPVGGIILKGHNVRTGTYDQKLTFENEDRTLLDEMCNCRTDLSNTRHRTLLGSFLFTGDDAFKPISVLSGGERARLNLLKLLLGNTNFLMLDEPTNHLDILSREILEDALLEYEGTLLVISHDRYFLDRVCTRIIELQPDGATEYLGNYSAMVRKKSENSDTNPTVLLDESITKTQIKAARKQEKDREREIRAQKKQTQEAEQKIALLEETIEQLNGELCLESVYSDPEQSCFVQSELSKLRLELDQAYALWDELLGSV